MSQPTSMKGLLTPNCGGYRISHRFTPNSRLIRGCFALFRGLLRAISRVSRKRVGFTRFAAVSRVFRV
eukprot:3230626-Prymnesium_polylepis.1